MMAVISNSRNDIYAKLIPIKREISCKQVDRFFSSSNCVSVSHFDVLDETSSDNAGQDNRNLCDEGSANQTLQHDEIEQMKSEGASGQSIISQLVSKSATFDKKTVYSQQKYLNKKKKKYYLRSSFFSIILAEDTFKSIVHGNQVFVFSVKHTHMICRKSCRYHWSKFFVIISFGITGIWDEIHWQCFYHYRMSIINRMLRLLNHAKDWS